MLEASSIFLLAIAMLLFAGVMYFVIKWAVSRTLLDCGVASEDAQQEAKYATLLGVTLSLIRGKLNNPRYLTAEVSSQLSKLQEESLAVASSVEGSTVNKIKK